MIESEEFIISKIRLNPKVCAIIVPGSSRYLPHGAYFLTLRSGFRFIEYLRHEYPMHGKIYPNLDKMRKDLFYNTEECGCESCLEPDELE